MTKEVTVEAFLHGTTSDALTPLLFLRDKGGKVVWTSDNNAHVLFSSGTLQADEAITVLDWAKNVHSQATSGRVIVLIDKCEPNSFEWHDPDAPRQGWQEGFNEYVCTFGSKFTHLRKNN
ncbi:hypothetical protein HAP94_07160 [Acidithiobacillus ferrivorans]|nr:hypothetical protein [Acidithiobacillus ferrivorans]